MINEERRVKTLVVALLIFSFAAGTAFGMACTMRHNEALKAEIEQMIAKERRNIISDVEIVSVQMKSFRENEERFESYVCTALGIEIPRYEEQKKVRPTPTPTPHP